MLRADLFRHALGLDMAYQKDRTPGEMIERIDGDVSSVANLFSQFLVRVSGALLMTVGVLTLLWREDWHVGAVMTIFTAAAARVLHWRRSIAVGPTRDEREASAQLFGFIEERLTGIDDIRANGAGRYVMHRFLEVQRGWFTLALRAWWLRSTIWLSMGTLFATGYVLTLSLGVGLYLAKYGVERHAFPMRAELRPSRHAVQINRNVLGGQLSKRLPTPSSQKVHAVIDRKFPLLKRNVRSRPS